MKTKPLHNRQGAISVKALLAIMLLFLLVAIVGIMHRSQQEIREANNVTATNAGTRAVAAESAPAAIDHGPNGVPLAPASTIHADGNQRQIAQANGPKINVQELRAVIEDSRRSKADRQNAAKALATSGSAEAMAALKEALASGPEDVRAIAARALGECGSLECTSALVAALNDPSELVVRAVIEGLSTQDSPGSLAALKNVMNDQQRKIGIRTAAVEGMAEMNTPGTFETLSQAALTERDTDFVSDILSALGKRNFDETGDFFKSYLQSPATEAELRKAATEALAQAQGNPNEFLTFLLSDADADVRAAAAWSMSATTESGTSGGRLLTRLQAETDPEVRLRLYQALQNQESFDTVTALNLLRQEQDPGARAAGLDALAKVLRENPNAELQAYFDQQAVPDLKAIALGGDLKSYRLAAVLALTRAGTPTAIEALQYVAQQSTDPRVKSSAQSGLPKGAGAGK